MAKNLRTFLRQIAEVRPDELLAVHREVDPEFEITAVAEKLQQRNEYPGLFFTRVKGSKLPLVINSCATFERLAMSLGVDLVALEQSYASFEASPIPHKVVSRDEAPVQEEVYQGDQVDLSTLPITAHNEHDAGRYISSGVCMLKDDESGRQNAGIYRLQVHGKNQLGLMINPGNHGNYLRLHSEDEARPMPVAIMIGHHPAVMMAAVSKIPGPGGEIDVAGALLGEPLEMVPALTVDLLVPAQAEMIIEGVVYPQKRHPEGPFGEWPGYYTKAGDEPIIEVQAITMRHDAIYMDLFNAHAEHAALGAVPRLGSLYRTIKSVCPSLKAVNLPVSGGCRSTCYISMKKRVEGEPKRAAFAAFITDYNVKHVVVVDDDIDVFNETEVMWALNMHFQADRDLAIIPNSLGSPLVPTAYGVDRNEHGDMETKVIFDATRPLPPHPFPKRARVPEEIVAGIDLAGYLTSFDMGLLQERVAAGAK